MNNWTAKSAANFFNCRAFFLKRNQCQRVCIDAVGTQMLQDFSDSAFTRADISGQTDDVWAVAFGYVTHSVFIVAFGIDDVKFTPLLDKQ